MKIANPQTRLFLVASTILVAGMASSAYIYRTAEITPGASEYEFEVTKKTLRDMELIGGKANVLTAEFSKWFDGLWHGKSLAFTVAFLTILIYLMLFWVAHRKTSGPK